MVKSLKDNETRKEPLGNSGYSVFVSRHHAFGTDAVLLSHFAGARPNDLAVDLGTGCGVIPLLWLKDGKTKHIFGVEISEEAVSLCKKTVESQNLSDRFTPLLCDIKAPVKELPFGSATLVTCNPPYKAEGAGIKNPDSVLSVARHEVACNLGDIIDLAYRLLNTSGRFCICGRPERAAEVIRLMSERGLEPKRMRLVCQRKGEEPWLVLIEGKKCAKVGLRIAPTLYVEENGTWSEEMLSIYGNYKSE